MKSKAIFLALLAFVFEAQADRVYPTDVKRAAVSWVSRKGAVGCQLGGVVDRLVEHTTTNGATFYAVKMSGGGTVFMSADTMIEPVLAFTGSEADYSTLDRRSPLWALLNRDLSVRQALADGANRPKSSQTGASGAGVTAAEAKWAELLGGETSPKSATVTSGIKLSDVNVRVPKLVQSAWDQADAGGGYHQSGGKACYNYYTPLSATKRSPGDVNNAVCGCVATAMAQLMRYHRYPATAVDPITRKDCFFDKTAISLTMQGGTYEWDAMPFTTSSATSEANRKAIGKLTSDAGISVGMMYTTDDSGSWSHEAKNALANVFGFKQVRMFSGYSSAAAKKVLYANFDAGLPVIMGISGSGGHEIVGDGYGFSGDTPYVHLNMGWSGSSDVWYNLPDIEAGGHTFNVIDEIIYNVMPEGAKNVILSGRATDDDGRAVGGARVRVRNADTAAEVASTNTNSRGIYAFVLPAGKYDLELELDGSKCADALTGVVVQAPVEVKDDSGWGRQPDGTRRTLSTPLVKSSGNAGNSWGNDFAVVVPTVQIEVDGKKMPYSCLDKALVAAKAFYAADPSQAVVVEVIGDTELKVAVTIDFPCEIRSADGVFAVERVKNAGITIASGGSLRVDGLAFSNSALTLVDVAAGGSFVLGADVSLGLDSTAIPAVRTTDATGLTLVAPLQEEFALDCAAAHGIGAVFARFEGMTEEEAKVAAAMIINIHDSFGETRGVVRNGTELVWEEVSVPIEGAVGYYVDNEGGTNTAARHDRLFPKFFAAVNDGTAGSSPELVLIESGSLSNGSFTVVGDCVIRSANEGVVISNSALVAQNQSTTGFNVTKGTLSVIGVTFCGFSGNRPFVTIDGPGAGFVLGREACLENVAVAGMGDTRGPVTVVNGQCVLAEGSAIVGCQSSSCGGGVCVGAAGALTVNGGVISNCYAKANGGGAYVAQGASVELSGASVICCNSSGSSKPYKEDDVYLGQGVCIDLPAPMTDGRIGVRSPETSVNKGASPFAAGSLAGLELEMTAKAFFKDGDGSKVAVAEDNWLKWGEPTAVPEHGPTEDPTLAYAQVTYSDGRKELWESTQWLLEALSNSTEAVTVELLRDDVMEAVVPIRAQVRLSSVAGVCTLSRAPGAGFLVLEGASLTIADLTLRGGRMGDDEPSEVPLIKAVGGEVSLESGAMIEGVLGDGNRDAGAVTVWNHGVFRMASGAVVRGCTNMFTDVSVGAGNGGAVLIDYESSGYLLGGSVTECAANKGGGVSVANQSTVHVGNDMTIDGNFRLSGEPNDLQVHANSSLTLDASLADGKIGYVEGVGGDRIVFGEVSDSFAGGDDDVATSARHFWHNVTDDVGAAVTDGTETLLVWSSAVDVEGAVIVGDRTYRIVEGGEPVAVPLPTAEENLRYQPSVERTGVLPKMGYELSGNVATLAGSYVAVATLRKGFVWSDGTSDPVTIPWTIAKAVYDMSQVVFESKTVVFDGKVHYLQVPVGVLPDGVKVTYENNNKSAVGVYEVVAKFAGDGDNYEPIPDMTATLTILDQPLPPPEPDPVPCEPFAFTAILNPSEGSWQLTINPAVKYCKYTVLASDDLKTWTPVIVDEEATADGDKIFTLPATGPQKFWQAIGKDGEKPVEGN